MAVVKQKSSVFKSFLFLFLIFLFSILSGCGLTPATISAELPTIQPSLTPAPTPPNGLPDCLLNLSYKENGQVVAITDGDTIHVSINGQEYKLRYVGMDTPEVFGEKQFYGPEASEKNRELVAGKNVLLFKDHSNTDRYDRLLRYVVVDGVFVNLELVREGFAYAKDYPPDTTCSKVFHQAEDQARREKLGLWGKK
jgi:micrococcal nuclease